MNIQTYIQTVRTNIKAKSIWGLWLICMIGEDWEMRSFPGCARVAICASVTIPSSQLLLWSPGTVPAGEKQHIENLFITRNTFYVFLLKSAYFGHLVFMLLQNCWDKTPRLYLDTTRCLCGPVSETINSSLNVFPQAIIFVVSIYGQERDSHTETIPLYARFQPRVMVGRATEIQSNTSSEGKPPKFAAYAEWHDRSRS